VNDWLKTVIASAARAWGWWAVPIGPGRRVGRIVTAGDQVGGVLFEKEAKLLVELALHLPTADQGRELRARCEM
jgi:hypothetical protein